MNSEYWQKYPRTYHHPSSPGLQSDDKVARDLSGLDGAEVVVTEKMDGENTTLYADGYHARSLDSGFHPSRSWLAGFHSQIAWRIPEGWRVCGENLFARHALAYERLASYFMAFSVWNRDTCLSWYETEQFCAERDIAMVPVLWRGQFSDEALARMTQALDLDRTEGLVVRRAAAFAFEDFARCVVKWVRPGHVQTVTHWRNAPIIKNGLAT